MNQYVFADVSVSSIARVAHGSVPAAKSSLKATALLPVNLQNSGSFGEPSAEQSSPLHQPKPVIGNVMPKSSAKK